MIDETKITDAIKQKTLDELNSEDTSSKIEENVTKVTSIAEEEKESGQKIELPDVETLVARAGIEVLKTRKGLVDCFSKMSKKQTLRTISAIFSLPEDGVPVLLKSEHEKVAFALGQRHIMSRFTLMHHHISKIRKEELAKQQQNSSNEGENNE